MVHEQEGLCPYTVEVLLSRLVNFYWASERALSRSAFSYVDQCGRCRVVHAQTRKCQGDALSPRVFMWWTERDMRGTSYRQGMDRHGWPDIEIGSLDYLMSQGGGHYDSS
jgi:hypothetical protein